MLEELGTDQGSSTVSEQAQTQIQSEIEKGNVRPDFLDTINSFRKEAGLTTQEPDTAPLAQKTEPETKVEEAKVTPEETTEDPAEEKEGEQVESDDLKTPEGETVKATRIAEVKQWGKNWQDTANTYKPANDFITEKFQGNMEEAEIAANLFESVLGTDIEKFDPSTVFNELAELSKPRAEKLIHFFATNESVRQMAEQSVIEKIFGSNLSQEELQEDLEGYKLFKQAGGLSALLDEDGELPTSLQYDADGNPRSEEELGIFKTFLNELKGIKTERQKESELKAEQEKVQRETALNSRIESYTEERFDGVKKVIKQLGLEVSPSDSPEAQAEKNRGAKMINFFVVGMASEDPNFNSAYVAAVNAIKEGDSITANRKKVELDRLVAKYTSDIVDDYIAKNNLKIDYKTNQINKALDTKKEVNLSGGEVSATGRRPANETVEQSIERLISEGKLRQR